MPNQASLLVIVLCTVAFVRTHAYGQDGIQLADPPSVQFRTVAELVEASKPFVCRVEASSGHASGALISSDGLILTCAHSSIEGTLKQGDRVNVVFEHGEVAGAYPAEVIHVGDMRADIALLKAEGLISRGWLPVGIGDALQAGNDVIALGYPNFPKIGPIGLAASKGALLVTDYGPRDAPRIASDVAIASGSSGGPLLDIRTGRIIGVNVAATSLGALTETAAARGESFATRHIMLSVPTVLLSSRFSVSFSRDMVLESSSGPIGPSRANRKKLPPPAAASAAVVGERFIELYEGSGSPRILFISESSSRSALEIATRLLSAVRGHFHKPEMNVINEFLAVDNGQIDSSSADLLVRIFVEDSAFGGDFSCRYEIIDLRRNEEIGSHPWSMPTLAGKGGKQRDESIRTYAHAVASALADDFMDSLILDRDWSPFRDFRINMISARSLSASQRNDLVRSVSILPRIQPGSVRVFEQDLLPAQESEVIAIDCRYSGSLSELQAGVAEALLSRMSIASEVTKLREGRIDMIIYNANPTRRQEGEASREGDQEIKQSFVQMHRKVGSPRIGVSVAFDPSRKLDQSAAIIGIGRSHDASGAGSDEEARTAIREMGAIANGIVDDWGAFGIDMQVVSHGDVEGVSSDGLSWEVARSLGQSASAQVVIIGIMKLVESGVGVGKPYIRYEFGMYDLRDGRVIASEVAKLDTHDPRRITPDLRRQIIAWFTRRLAEKAVLNW